MAITAVDKMKILKFFRENAFGEIYYTELVEYLGKKSKVTDTEFTEFFASYVIDSLKKEKLSINLLNKMVSSLTSFIGWFYDEKVDIDKELQTKLYSIRAAYEEHLSTTSEERNPKLDDLIRELEEALVQFYPQNENRNPEINIDELVAELNTLQIALTESENEIVNLTANLDRQNKALENKKKANTRLSSRLEESRQKERKLSDSIKDLEKTVAELNTLIASLKAELTASTEKYNALSALKDKIQTDYFGLKAEIKTLRRTLEDREREIIRLHEEDDFKILIPKSNDYTEEKNNRIEGLIIQKMLTGKYTLEEIQEYLFQNGYPTLMEDLLRHFRSIKNKMSFLVPEPTEEPQNTNTENNEYQIFLPFNTRCLDLMVVSDFHLSKFGKEVIEDMELINEYCDQFGIRTILNVGDFFSWSRLESKHGLSCQKLVDRAIAKYPLHKGIKHAVLGGNHDKDMFSDGLDPIKMLADAREDFINLGYGHCKITFGGSVSILDTIGMHHPNRRYPELAGAGEYSTSKVRDSLNSYYITNGIKAEDVYVELLGHIHKSSLDSEHGICIVPSYRKDRILNGAWHLKVYFTEDKHISNIVFIPIIKQKKLIPTTEICYKKQLIKK